MKLIPNFLRKTPVISEEKKPLVIPEEKKRHVIGLNDALSEFLKYGNDAGSSAASAMNVYNKSTAASVPINLVGDAFANITPVIKENGKVLIDHPILELLRNPSPHFTQNLFLEMLAKTFLITGETGFVALGNINYPPAQLHPMDPKSFGPLEGAGGLATQWDITGETLAGSYSLDLKQNRSRYLNGNFLEFKQIRNYSTRGGSLLRGYSPLSSASAETRQHILGNSHNVSLLEKGGRLSLVFHFSEDLTPAEYEETKARVNAQYGGAGKAGAIGVTAGGELTIKEVGINNKDMDFLNLQTMAKQAVALVYKVPLPLVSLEATSFNNYAQAKLALYDDAVLPLADRLFGGISSMLVPRFGMDPAKIKITYDMDQVTALSLRRNEELQLRKNLDIESINELRSLIGRKDVEGGDIIYKAANMLPIGTDLITAPVPTVLRDD